MMDGGIELALAYGTMHMCTLMLIVYLFFFFRESLGPIIGGFLDYSVGFQSLAAVRSITYAVLIMSIY